MTNEQAEKEWQDLVEKEALSHEQHLWRNSTYIECDNGESFKMGAKFAEANAQHMPKVAELIEAVRGVEDYAIHLQRCASRNNTNYKCDCGLQSKRDALKALEKGE